MLNKRDNVPLVFAAIVILMAFGFMIAVMGQGATQDVRTVDVSGQATIEVSPDEAVLYFGYEVQKTTAADAQADSASVIDSVRSALESEGLARSDIETSYYTVSPVKKWDDETWEYQITGYQAIHILKITTQDIEDVGTYVDSAVQAGANRFDSVNFGLTDEKEAEVRNQALIQASQSAKNKAQSIASGLGLALGRVQSSSESFGYYPYYARSYLTEMEAGAGEPVPTEITPGEVTVSATVSVSYEIV